MEKIIRIFDPREKPYGSLSNNSTSYFELDNKKWKTVTHYTYSNLLHFPTFKELVKNQIKVKDVYPTFLKLYSQEIHDITVSAINEASKEKFKNENLKKLLLATEGYNIFYISDDPILGGHFEEEKFVGENTIGRVLMSIRHSENVKNKKTEVTQNEKIEEQIYKIYKAYQVLETIVNKNNSDVVQLEDLSYDEIINSLPSLKFADKKIIIELYNNGTFPIINEEFENPGNLVALFRKKHIDKINNKIILTRSNVILRMYLTYILKKSVETDEEFKGLPETKFENIRSEALEYLNTEQLVNLRQRISYLFEKGLLSASLSNEIDEVLSKFPKPFTQSEINAIKSFTLTQPETKDTKENKIKDEQNRAIYIYSEIEKNPPEIQPLSPFAYTPMEIFALKFPTVIHYIYIKLISILRQYGTLNLAYNLIKDKSGNFIDIPSLNNAYNYEKDMEYVQGIEGFTVRAMDHKFSRNYSLQDLLISTVGSKIVYTDRNPILGTGTKKIPGNDLVGKYLMEIRYRIVKERSKIGQVKIKAEGISKMLFEDEQLYTWMQNRLTELCQTIGIVREYLSTKYESEYQVEVSPNFLLILIQSFYPSCFNIYSKNENNKPPNNFIGILSTCPGLNLFKPKGKGLDFDSNKQELVEVFWNYFTSMFYGVIKFNPNITQVQLRKLLSAAELVLNNGKQCLPVRLEDEKENCILSSLINLLKSLKNLVGKYYTNFSIDETDIWAVTKILLNGHIKLPNNFPKNSSNEIEKEVVLENLREIDPFINLSMVDYLLEVVTFINEYKGMPKTTKQNRVNFFAE